MTTQEQKLRFILIGLLITFCHREKCVTGKAYNRKTDRAAGDTGPPFDDALQSYLTRFGYLPQDNREMSNLRKDDAVHLALTRLQEFAGLDQTGQLDRETRRLIATKRCGLPDVPYDGSGDSLKQHRAKRYVLHGAKWHKLNLTYMVKNSARTLDLPRTRRVLYDAVQVWSKASRLKFQESADEFSADIVVKFASGSHGDSYPFDGPNVVLAHAFFPADGLGGDVHFDDDEPWTDDPQKYDNKVVLLSTAAHEIGHSLGMGHSRVQNSLMYPYYKYDMDEVKLEYDDILAVQAIYGVGTHGVPVQTDDIPSTTGSPGREHGERGPGVERVTMGLPPATTASSSIPEPCDSHIDAVATIRNEIFVFKNKYYWRFDENGVLVERPSEIIRFWYGLPENLTKIDAIYERADKNRVIIFIGRSFYEFHGNHLAHGARDVADLGLPDHVRRLDASFVWEYNDRTYLFAGGKYWRFDEQRRVVEPDYPREVGAVWRRLPVDGIDAAFTDKTGSTYFFKDDSVYKFNNYFMRVEKNQPKPISKFWTYCEKKKRELQQQLQMQPSQSYPCLINHLLHLCILTLCCCFFVV